MLESILVSGSVALILSVICIVAWRTGVRRVEAEKERMEMVPDAIIGRDYRRIFHDIKSPLTAVKLVGDLLICGWNKGKSIGDINADASELGQTILESSDKVLDLMKSVSTPDVVQEINIAEAIRTNMYICGKGAPVSVRVKEDAKIVCVPILFSRLLGNIFSNAVRHSIPNSLITVAGEYSGVGFCVTNSIRGHVDCNSLWESADPKGTTGLSIIKSLAEDLGLLVVIRCVRNGVGNGGDHTWVFEVEVSW
jgi:signal transduction histidine kinase